MGSKSILKIVTDYFELFSVEEAPLNLCTKPRKSLEIWSPGSLCEKEEVPPPNSTSSSQSNERTFQVSLLSFFCYFFSPPSNICTSA